MTAGLHMHIDTCAKVHAHSHEHAHKHAAHTKDVCGCSQLYQLYD